MTKPITAVAALMLWEEGRIELTDPVSRYIPSFAGAVRRSGSVTKPVTDPITEEMRLWHLFTHTAGLTYGFLWAHPVDELYRRAGFEWVTPPGADLADVCDRLAGLPLLFQPGREWNQQHRDRCARPGGRGGVGPVPRRVLRLPHLRAARHGRHRLPRPRTRTAPARRAYIPTPGTRQILRMDARRLHASPPACLKPAGWTRLHAGRLPPLRPDAARRGQPRRRAPARPAHGAVHGVEPPARRSGPQRVRASVVRGDDVLDGVGFRLGVSVTIDPVKLKTSGSVGDFGWGGAASTSFWADPVEDLTVVFMTQRSVEHPPDPLPAATARPPGARRLI